MFSKAWPIGWCKRLVGVGDIDPGLDQAARQGTCRLPVAAHAEGLVRRLVPRVVGRAPVLPGLDVLVVVGEHGKRRDDVLLEILVLVVAPHDDQIGLEIVERLARLGEMAAVDLARPRRGRRAPIVAELFAQRGRPARRVLHLVGHRRVVERGLHHEGPVLVAAQHHRPVGAAHPQDLAHRSPPICRNFGISSRPRVILRRLGAGVNPSPQAAARRSPVRSSSIPGGLLQQLVDESLIGLAEPRRHSPKGRQ